ncbi:gliding motility lipoprotein GldH [Nonlabens sp. Asnod3-H03]|uniref:gliding motility lipoprotein GldH n=1 Tax=Nonlabens sp. Asnod3-H03 TaxID=3160580 RepID=UPI003869C20F
MRITLLLILSCITLISCDHNIVKTQSVAFSDAQWSLTEAPVFKIESIDTVNTYDMFLNLRNNHDYAYSNLYLIAEMKFPQGKIVTDTLEYDMATPQGQFLGTGYSDVYENKLWYKEGVRFRESGTYLLTLRHAMRKNGSVDGIAQLKGVLDIGYSIEKQVQHGSN